MKQHFYMVSASFSASSSCLEFLPWFPLIMDCKLCQVSFGQCFVTTAEQPYKIGIYVYQEMPDITLSLYVSLTCKSMRQFH